MARLQRSSSLPLELDSLSTSPNIDDVGSTDVPHSPLETASESDGDSTDWLFPRRWAGEPHSQNQPWTWAVDPRSVFRNLRRGTKHFRRRFGVSTLSIFRVALLFALLNLTCVALYKSLKSTFREAQLRHDLRGGTGRSWVWAHNDEEHGDDAYNLSMDLGVGAIEVDVWLGAALPSDPSDSSGSLPGDPAEHDLLVGHHQTETSPSKTLKNVYLEPLMRLMDSRRAGLRIGRDRSSNGSSVFTEDRELYLVIDLKHKGDVLFQYLEKALQPFLARGHLTTYDPEAKRWNYGSIRVVGTGETPLARVVHQSPRYIFYDAPLLNLGGEHVVPATSYSREETIHFTPEISPIASAKLPRSYHLGMFFPKWRPVNPFIELLQAYSNEARRNGLEPRWWGYAQYTAAIRKKMWKLLAAGGSKWVSADDLVGATRWLIKRDKKQRRLDQLQIERGTAL